MSIPKPIIYAVLTLVILAMIPPALIARDRAVPNARRRIHLVQDMDNQHKFRAQHESPSIMRGTEKIHLFKDHRAMRPVVPGTIARGELRADDHYERGVKDNAWATTFPAQVEVNMALLERGRERFNIYCQPCHGLTGEGDGIIHRRGSTLMLDPNGGGTTWVPPKNIHEEAIRQQPVGQMYNNITNGVRNMAGYGAQIPVHDRWAIVAYVKALQRSRHAEISDVPERIRGGMLSETIDERTPPAEPESP